MYPDGEVAPGLASNIREAAGIYKTNVVMMNTLGNEDLRKNIERDGVEIYNREAMAGAGQES